MPKLLALLVLMTGPVLMQAQSDDALQVIPGYDAVNWTNQLPEKLLTARTAVFIKRPDLESGRRPAWQELAEKAQRGFQQIGIDAMAYYYLNDVIAGQDATGVFMSYLKKRRVENILILEELASGELQAIITSYDGGAYLFKPEGQEAVRFTAAKLDALFRLLYLETLRQELTRTNILINDYPEYYSAIKIIRGKGFKRHNPDLKIDRMAFPLAGSFAVANRKDARQMDFADITVSGRDTLMMRILEELYPFEYGLVNPKVPEDELRALGYQYVFTYLHTTGKTIRQMLGYELSELETDYVTTIHRGAEHSVKTIPIDQPVYKFYARHIYTGDVYLGAEWDADLSWEEAFRNFLENMRIDLKVDQP